MVIVVDAGWSLQVGRGGPGAAAGLVGVTAHCRLPAEGSGVHAGVVGVAGEGEFVDVGGVAVGPVVVGVVDLALVDGHSAFGFRAAAVGAMSANR